MFIREFDRFDERKEIIKLLEIALQMLEKDSRIKKP